MILQNKLEEITNLEEAEKEIIRMEEEDLTTNERIMSN